MGSLTSRPKINTTPQVVYVPAPSASPTPSPGGSGAAQGSTQGPPQGSAEGGGEGGGNQNLLLRDRGIFGTVLTGFRGLLAPAATPARKSLLGE